MNAIWAGYLILFLFSFPKQSVPWKFAWYLDLTPNRMFSLYDNYPIPGKTGLLLCELHGQQLELKETVVRDNETNEKSHLYH
jgi:hypothetical protein